jgi:hypothetical protein
MCCSAQCSSVHSLETLTSKHESYMTHDWMFAAEVSAIRKTNRAQAHCSRDAAMSLRLDPINILGRSFEITVCCALKHSQWHYFRIGSSSRSELSLSTTDYTGLNLMPNICIAWSPDAPHMLWPAVFKAERTRSELDPSTTLNWPGIFGSESR